MKQAELASRLATESDAGREKLLAKYAHLADTKLGWLLKDICLDAWTSNPARSLGAAASLALLSRFKSQPEIIALSTWTNGMTALVKGQMKNAVEFLDDSAARFEKLNQPNVAASTQIGKLYALAMLGRYAEAIDCGLGARSVFLEYKDYLSAGKVEHNLGNLFRRVDRYEEAEEFLRAARQRFLAVSDYEKLAQIDNSLAYVLSFQHKFREAESLYHQALQWAEQANLSVTQAEIESSLGYLALLKGNFDAALNFLEKSRRKYAALGMPHESALAEQEIADAYLELNLFPEASAIYARVETVLDELEMPFELSRAFAYHGRACLELGQMSEARNLLAEAQRLYTKCGSETGTASVSLVEAELSLAAGDYEAAITAAERAEKSFAKIGIQGKLLQSLWLRGEALRLVGNSDEAKQILLQALEQSQHYFVPQIALQCFTSLGLLAVSGGDVENARNLFEQAVSQIEDLRAPLPAEDFRTAFFADKLKPYYELTRLCLAKGDNASVAEALDYVERARSRSLFEMIAGTTSAQNKSQDAFEAEQTARLAELREELNWFYSRINRPTNVKMPQMESLQQAVLERENEILEITRQLKLSEASGGFASANTFDLKSLQEYLGDKTALLEYTFIDDELLVFVVTGAKIEVVRNLAVEKEVNALLKKLRFQIDGLRHGAKQIRSHLADLTFRARHYLKELYGVLLKPLESLTEDRRLIIVPHRSLHYIPFHALFDGTSYEIEKRGISHTPSASILLQCVQKQSRPFKRALLVGVPDEQMPRIEDEIASIAPFFDQSIVLVKEKATLQAFKENAPQADVLHLACHGQFRPDNPLFSSLKLDDGWFNVRDAYEFNLNCGLVALSACETGVSAVSPGDELIGLIRGFFTAGAPSLLLSLWAVDDEATALLMTEFYRSLSTGAPPATALQAAQKEILKQHSHPFFWASFMLIGRGW